MKKNKITTLFIGIVFLSSYIFLSPDNIQAQDPTPGCGAEFQTCCDPKDFPPPAPTQCDTNDLVCDTTSSPPTCRQQSNTYQCKLNAIGGACDIVNKNCRPGYSVPENITDACGTNCSIGGDTHNCVFTPAANTYDCVWESNTNQCLPGPADDCEVGFTYGTCPSASSASECTSGNPRTCILAPNPTPTFPPAIPALNCGTCGFADTNNECNANCQEKVGSSPGTCLCEPQDGVLQCNQDCSNGTNASCGNGCGNCDDVDPSILGFDWRCVNDNGGITPQGPIGIPIEQYDPCKGVESANRQKCRDCVAGGGAWAAIGPNNCIPTDPSGFAAEIIKILFGLAGGVAFLLIIYGAFICITSQGNPQKAQACRETITSAIVGLLMLIFALFIVRLIFGPIGIIPGLIDIF